jgi:hypothetical protein
MSAYLIRCCNGYNCALLSVNADNISYAVVFIADIAGPIALLKRTSSTAAYSTEVVALLSRQAVEVAILNTIAGGCWPDTTTATTTGKSSQYC